MLASATLFMIFAGAMVTTLKAGDSVPDWPLSYGQVLPPMKGLVFFEHGHRMVGWLVGFLSLAYLVSSRFGGRAWAILGLVLFQGVLGGIRVLVMRHVAMTEMEKWREILAMAHAVTAQIFFSLILITALPLPAPKKPEAGLESSFRIALVLTVIQVLLGILGRQTGRGLMVHAAFALAALAGLSLFASRLSALPRTEPLQAGGAWISLLLLVQAGLGLAALFFRLQDGGLPPGWSEALVRSSHVALGALTLGLCLCFGLPLSSAERKGAGS